MTDPRTAQPPTEEEMRAYLQALRDAEVSDLLAQACSLLATGAEVKLGRPDARPLIDGLSALVDATARALPSALVERLRQQIAQLKIAQVQLENEAAEQQAAGAGQQQTAGAAAASSGSASAAGQTAGRSSQPPQQERKMTDRLWIPGRDAPPRR
ncbi:MAG TPA: hypothetical protein VIK95_08190 [Egibacteraceae bacterium]